MYQKLVQNSSITTKNSSKTHQVILETREKLIFCKFLNRAQKFFGHISSNFNSFGRVLGEFMTSFCSASDVFFISFGSKMNQKRIENSSKTIRCTYASKLTTLIV